MGFWEDIFGYTDGKGITRMTGEPFDDAPESCGNRETHSLTAQVYLYILDKMGFNGGSCWPGCH